jgi:CheY-like chemotaxis protein
LTHQSGELADAQRETPLRVLLVEDEILIRIDLAESLRDQGWDVIEAGTAIDALDLLRLIVVDIVVTDVHMPGGMTGIDLARSIRDGWPGLPVVVMSGLHRPQDEKGQYFDAFQSKPVANIVSVVEAVLATRSS